MEKKKYKLELSEKEWRERLSPEQFRVLRGKGTERPFTGIYDAFFEKGVYLCAACNAPLFESASKFNSGCGWPAFDREISENAIEFQDDNGFGMRRTEILCNNCGGHLGHVFDDGPTETGQRFCVNSASLQFKEKEKED